MKKNYGGERQLIPENIPKKRNKDKYNFKTTVRIGKQLRAQIASTKKKVTKHFPFNRRDKI